MAELPAHIAHTLDVLKREQGLSVTPRLIWVSIAQQQLYVLNTDDLQAPYADSLLDAPFAISTALKGVGQQEGSYQTPAGLHCIADKIGAACPELEIFKGRVPQGQCAERVELPESTGQDLITSRILWLKGLQAGLNCGGSVDSYQRYIYIHGTPEEGLIGQPASHGCVRMNNKDVIHLFDRVEEGDWVYIDA